MFHSEVEHTQHQFKPSLYVTKFRPTILFPLNVVCTMQCAEPNLSDEHLNAFALTSLDTN